MTNYKNIYKFMILVGWVSFAILADLPVGAYCIRPDGYTPTGYVLFLLLSE